MAQNLGRKGVSCFSPKSYRRKIFKLFGRDMKQTLILIFFAFLSGNLFSQEFGEDYEQYLKMTSFEQEPDADILVIFDRGEASITQDFNLEVSRHVRIKVLTQEGKEFANVKIGYWHEDRIYNLDAASYSPSGEVYEMNSDNIFDEGSDRIKVKSFAIPGVEIGSVIEYKYNLFSDYITNIEPWTFQGNNYTLESQFSLIISAGFTFNTLKMNVDNIDFSENSELFREINNLGSQSKRVTWTAKNVHGIKKEPYVDYLDDYFAKIIIIFNSFKNSNVYYSFAKSWTEIGEKLDKGYSKLTDDEIDLPKELEEIVESKSDSLTKAKQIYDYICKLKTTSNTGIYASNFKDLEAILETKSGSASEKNILLINLLRRIGLKANPVLVSLRDNGEVIPDFVDPAQFNRIICLLDLGREMYFLYTGSSFNQFGYLIPSYNVKYGLEVSEKKTQIINLAPKQYINKMDISTVGELTLDGILNLESTFTYEGYSAYDQRSKMEDANLDEWIEKKVKDLYETASVDTFYIVDKTIDEPLKIVIKYNIDEYIEEAGDLVYFTPPLFTNIKESVFIREKREFPVNFSYENSIYEKFQIKLPTNYSISISEEQSKKKLNIPNYSYVKMVSSDGENNLKILKTTNRKERTFKQSEYPKLKSFFEKVLEYDTEQIVLNKISKVADK